jgi:lysylphosphatidylglycerol synthetase-like protein (DUF2156 family)
MGQQHSIIGGIGGILFGMLSCALFRLLRRYVCTPVAFIGIAIAGLILLPFFYLGLLFLMEGKRDLGIGALIFSLPLAACAIIASLQRWISGSAWLAAFGLLMAELVFLAASTGFVFGGLRSDVFPEWTTNVIPYTLLTFLIEEIASPLRHRIGIAASWT